MSVVRLASSDSFASLGPRPSKLNARSNVRWRSAFATLPPLMPAHELAALHGWQIRFAGSGHRSESPKVRKSESPKVRKSESPKVRKSESPEFGVRSPKVPSSGFGVRKSRVRGSESESPEFGVRSPEVPSSGFGVRKPDEVSCQTCGLADLRTCGLADLQTCRLADLRTCRLADFRTCRLADFRTFGLCGLSDRWGEGSTCVLQIMKAGHGSGGHRPPPRWQVTVRECRECPVRRTPSGSFRAHATSANHHIRVARASRMNGHTAIAGGRCLAAGIMPPPSSLSITRLSLRLFTY